MHYIAWALANPDAPESRKLFDALRRLIAALRFDDLPETWRAKLRLQPNADRLTPCWVWTGWNSGNGYGKVKISGRAWMAHRAIYTRLVGPIPPGLVLDHLCKTRACCNPHHVEPVTEAENVERGGAVLFQPKAMIA